MEKDDDLHGGGKCNQSTDTSKFHVKMEIAVEANAQTLLVYILNMTKDPLALTCS